MAEAEAEAAKALEEEKKKEEEEKAAAAKKPFASVSFQKPPSIAAPLPSAPEEELLEPAPVEKPVVAPKPAPAPTPTPVEETPTAHAPKEPVPERIPQALENVLALKEQRTAENPNANTNYLPPKVSESLTDFEADSEEAEAGKTETETNGKGGKKANKKKKKKKKNRPEEWARQAQEAERRKAEEEERKKREEEEPKVEVEYVADKLELEPSDPLYR